MLGKLAERESTGRVAFEIVQFEGLEVAYQNVAGKLILFQAREIIESLLLGTDEVPARTLLLNQEHSLPEQIDETTLFSELLYRFLEAGNSAAGDAKHLEKLVVEGLT